MVKIGEGFFSSLGFAPLPATFYSRSMFTKPADREVVCHASAWDIDNKDDLRIKMCIKLNADDFVTIHHELGHNYYQRAYNEQPFLYLNGANDGFHEAIGDAVALSITPEYLVQIGLLPRSRVPSADKDIGLLLRQAMDKVAFLPFGLLVDRYRWGMFDGSISPADYNKAWTKLRHRLSGHRPAGRRGRPMRSTRAPNIHIPGNTPYTRYFLARILQFQFYKAACDQAGWKGPLHRCSFYGNKEVGAAAQRDAGDGRVEAVARCARGVHRHPPDVGQGDGRIFRAAEGVARPAERRQDPGLVSSTSERRGAAARPLPFFVGQVGSVAIAPALICLDDRSTGLVVLPVSLSVSASSAISRLALVAVKSRLASSRPRRAADLRRRRRSARP